MQLKQKAEEEKAFQSKTSLSIPLVDEHSDDVKSAKKIAFGSSGLAQERKRKRLELKTQSVFDTVSSATGVQLRGAQATKARALLIAARSKSGGVAFGSPASSSSRHRPTRGGVVRTDKLRSALGVRTPTKQ